MSFITTHVLANCLIISIDALLGDFMDLRADDDDKIVVEPFVIGIKF